MFHFQSNLTLYMLSRTKDTLRVKWPPEGFCYILSLEGTGTGTSPGTSPGTSTSAGTNTES